MKQVTVVGGGVIGLTTAVKIQEKGGYRVTVVAETLPGDPKNIRYTSPWAGAHHVSAAGHNARLQKLDLDTLKVMWDLSTPGNAAEQCFLRLDHVEYYQEPMTEPEFLEMMPGFEYVNEGDASSRGAAYGIKFPTLTIDTPKYLEYLLSRLLAAGGLVVKTNLQHISQVIEGGVPGLLGSGKIAPSPVDALIICAGLGARTLGGVEDKTMFPVRGQTVLLKAPWVTFGRTMIKRHGDKTYVIPRKSGEVIVGGTADKDDWYPTPRPETTRDILERVVILCPELAPAEIRAQKKPTADDLVPLIIEEGCGLRPARAGGIRIELEWYKDIKGNRKVPIVHNYGHAGFGYQSSWGSADEALELLDGALEKA